MIKWASKTPRMRRGGGLFSFDDIVPDDYFTAEEIADLVSRGKITVTESREVVIGSSQAEQVEAPKVEQAEVEQAEVEQAEVEQAEHEQVEAEAEHEPEIDLGDGVSKPKKRGRKS